MSKPSGGICSLHSLSVWGLPTPVVAFACIGNVDIQVFSGAGCQLYFIRRLQACNIASPERGGGPAKLVEGFTREVHLLVQPCRNRPAEFARSSLSAWGLPTPVVVLASIGNVDIQVLSGAGG